VTRAPRAKVLIVDDRRENLVALVAILQGLPIEPVTVTSGEDALKRLLAEDFAVILLDAHMPGMDGFEAASHIKQRKRTQHLPIIFLTAADRDAHLAFRGYAAGAVDYITKPFDPWVLRAKISVFVELWAKNDQLREQAESARHREAEHASIAAAAQQAGEILRGALEDGAEDPGQLRKAAREAVDLLDGVLP